MPARHFFLKKGPWGHFLVVLFAVGLFCQAVESESDERDIRSVRMCVCLIAV